MIDRLISLFSSTAPFAQYVIANYIPDVRRFESRNIGVFVWIPGAIRAKFLPPERAATFVGDLKMYDRWIKFWSDRISSDEFVHCSNSTPKDSPLYLDALLNTQKGCYRLRLASEMLTDIPSDRLEIVVERLFNELVVPQPNALDKLAEPPSERYTVLD